MYMLYEMITVGAESCVIFTYNPIAIESLNGCAGTERAEVSRLAVLERLWVWVWVFSISPEL